MKGKGSGDRLLKKTNTNLANLCIMRIVGIDLVEE